MNCFTERLELILGVAFKEGATAILKAQGVSGSAIKAMLKAPSFTEVQPKAFDTLKTRHAGDIAQLRASVIQEVADVYEAEAVPRGGTLPPSSNLEWLNGVIRKTSKGQPIKTKEVIVGSYEVQDTRRTRPKFQSVTPEAALSYATPRDSAGDPEKTLATLQAKPMTEARIGYFFIRWNPQATLLIPIKPEKGPRGGNRRGPMTRKREETPEHDPSQDTE